jgi:hypothetical protein
MDSTIEKAALVGGGGCGIFSTVCEVLDTPDPDTKVFRFKDGARWGSTHADPKPQPEAVRHISIYSHWSEMDVGAKDGAYRVTAALEIPPGYIAVLEGTTKPQIQQESVVNGNGDETRCEIAIMAALESEPSMSLRRLKRKISAHRLPAFDVCLKRLAELGELRTFVKRNIANQNRTWVELAAGDSVSAVTGSNEIANSPVAEK